jgi:hypothetical protein
MAKRNKTKLAKVVCYNQSAPEGISFPALSLAFYG